MYQRGSNQQQGLGFNFEPADPQVHYESCEAPEFIPPVVKDKTIKQKHNTWALGTPKIDENEQTPENLAKMDVEKTPNEIQGESNGKESSCTIEEEKRFMNKKIPKEAFLYYMVEHLNFLRMKYNLLSKEHQLTQKVIDKFE